MTTTASRLTVAGALRRRIAKFAEQVTTPLVPSDYFDVIDPLRSGAALRGRIVAVNAETRDAVTVVIKTGRGWRTHVPGQYVRLGIDVDGVRRWRAYSLTSEISRRDGCIAITVKAIPGGIVSNHLVRKPTEGTLVHLDQPAGEFTIGAQPPPKILFLTAGSGITPVMGMLRNLAEFDTPPRPLDIVVVHSAPTAAAVIFGDELRMLARQNRIRLVERHTDVDGMLDVARLDDIVDDIADRHTWACGPVGLLDVVQRRWESDGLADRLHVERFRPAIQVTGDGGTVTFAKSGAVVDAEGSQTLLDVGEAAGVLMPSGCRMGICFGCVAPLRQGSVRDLRTGDVITATDGDGIQIQTCISGAAADCDIGL